MLGGVAEKLSLLSRRKFTGSELRSMGLRAVADAGKRMRRQYSVWWPNVMQGLQEPFHCAPGYLVGAQRLLAHAPCREVSST